MDGWEGKQVENVSVSIQLEIVINKGISNYKATLSDKASERAHIG